MNFKINRASFRMIWIRIRNSWFHFEVVLSKFSKESQEEYKLKTGQDFKKNYFGYVVTSCLLLFPAVSGGISVYSSIHDSVNDALEKRRAKQEFESIKSVDFTPEVLVYDKSFAVSIALHPSPSSRKIIDGTVKAKYSLDDGQYVAFYSLSEQITPNQNEVIQSHKIKFQFEKDNTIAGPFSYDIDPAGNVLSVMTSHILSDQNWFTCSNGECFDHIPPQYRPSLSAVELISPPGSAKRIYQLPYRPSQDLARFDPNDPLQHLLYVVPNEDVIVDLVFTNGSRSPDVRFHDRSNYPSMRGALIEGDMSSSEIPKLMMAYESSQAIWYVYPLPFKGYNVIGLSVDEGGFSDYKADYMSPWSGRGARITGGFPNGYVRIQYQDQNNSYYESKFQIGNNVRTNSDQAAVKSALDKLLSCRKFGAESIVNENDKTFAGIMSNNSKSMALTGGGFAFVHSPGIACILPQSSGGPVREAVHVLESFVLRGEPGGIKAEGIVQDIPDNPNKQVGDFRRNFGHAIIPPDIRELYVQFRFKDGSSSREIRIKVPEK